MCKLFLLKLILISIISALLCMLIGCTQTSTNEKNLALHNSNEVEVKENIAETQNTPPTSTPSPIPSKQSSSVIPENVPVDCIGHPAEKYIKIIIEKGLAKGYPDGTYLPDNQMTRIEVTAMMIKAAESQNLLKSPDPKTIAKLPFKDDNKIPQWSKGYLATALKLGFIKGYEDGTFRPDEKLTRLEITVIMSRYFQLDKISEQPLPFNDKDSIESWAHPYISKAYQKGIISAFEDNTFRPQTIVTRADVSVMTVKGLEAKYNKKLVE